MLPVDVRAGECRVLHAGHDHVRGAQVSQQGGDALRDQVLGLGVHEVVLGAGLAQQLRALLGLALRLDQPLVPGAGLARPMLLCLTGLNELPMGLGEVAAYAHVEEQDAHEGEGENERR